MGWTSYSMHKPIKDWIKEQWNHDDYEILDSALVKRTTLYAAVKQISTGDVFCGVCLISWSPKSYHNFSYKDMTEHSGPTRIECPPKIFKLLTPLNDTNDSNGWAREWRKKVEVLHANRKRLSKAHIIHIKEGVSFGRGNYLYHFMKVGKRWYATRNEDGNFTPQFWVTFNPLNYEFEVTVEKEDEKEIFCPMCKESCGRGMGSGRIYMLHNTVGCEAAKRY